MNYSDDVTYSDCFDDGEDVSSAKKSAMPLWRTPDTVWQKQLLSLFGMKYYPKDKALHHKIILIEKSMAPMGISKSADRLPVMPAEWVEFCIGWCRTKRSRGSLIKLESLINFINDEAARIQWIEKTVRNNQREDMTVKEYTSNVHVTEQDGGYGMETLDTSTLP